MNKNLLKNFISEAVLMLENEEKIETNDGPSFGELKSVLDSLKKNKVTENRIKHVISFFAKVTTGSVADLFNSGEFVEAGLEKALEIFKKKSGIDINRFIKKYNPFEALKRFYGINDNKGLEFMEIPDNLSNLVEDEIEDQFLYFLIDEIAKQNDKDIITREWVLKTFRQYTKNYNEKTKNAIAVTR